MKQLGNLAIICAMRDDLCLSIYKGQVTVHLGCGPNKEQITVDWNDERPLVNSHMSSTTVSTGKKVLPPKVR